MRVYCITICFLQYIVWLANNETGVYTHTLTKTVTVSNGKEYSDLQQVGKAIKAIMALI